MMEKIEVSCFVFREFLAAEAVKTLRTNLMFSGASVRVVGITSYSASEGKSTISFQLAASLAQNGKRVLLLDTDLRKSVLQRRMKLRHRVCGLSHCLSGAAGLKEVICETDIPGLHMLFAGTRVPTAAELLGSEEFKRLISTLREMYDYVIVDTPPLGQVIDCAVMAPAFDGVLMVIDTTRNSYKLERRMQNQIVKAGGKIPGVILNRVDFQDKTGYYGKGRDGKYGYG